MDQSLGMYERETFCGLQHQIHTRPVCIAPLRGGLVGKGALERPAGNQLRHDVEGVSVVTVVINLRDIAMCECSDGLRMLEEPALESGVPCPVMQDFQCNHLTGKRVGRAINASCRTFSDESVDSVVA